jgi:regulator of RNase E activity RraB
MSVLEELMKQAEMDAQLLARNDELGDIFSYYRDVDHCFISNDKSKAEALASFINDYRYANASIEQTADAEWRVLAISNMPINQNIINTVSGFMTCLAALFKVEYDGWGSVIQKNAEQGDSAGTPLRGAPDL